MPRPQEPEDLYDVVQVIAQQVDRLREALGAVARAQPTNRDLAKALEEYDRGMPVKVARPKKH